MTPRRTKSGAAERPVTTTVYVGRRRSRQPPPQRMAQENFEQDQAQPGRNEPREQFAVLGKFRYLFFGLLELVNLSVNRLEPLGVVGAVILAAGLVGDALQSVFVNINRHHLVHDL